MRKFLVFLIFRFFALFFGKISAGGGKNHENSWFLPPPALILPKNDAKNRKIKKTKNFPNVVCYEVQESHFSYQSSNIWYVKKITEIFQNFSKFHILRQILEDSVIYQYGNFRDFLENLKKSKNHQLQNAIFLSYRVGIRWHFFLGKYRLVLTIFMVLENFGNFHDLLPP